MRQTPSSSRVAEIRPVRTARARVLLSRPIALAASASVNVIPHLPPRGAAAYGARHRAHRGGTIRSSPQYLSDAINSQSAACCRGGLQQLQRRETPLLIRPRPPQWQPKPALPPTAQPRLPFRAVIRQLAEAHPWLCESGARDRQP